VRFQEIWDALYIESGTYSPFSSFGWIKEWWNWFGEKRRLFIVIASHRGKTVGIAPMMLSQDSRFIRRLEFLVDDNGSRFDFAVLKENRETFFNGLTQILIQNRDLWDECFLNYFPCDSKNFAGIRHTLAPSRFWVGQHFFHSPFIVLDESWELYLKNRKKKFRSNLKRLTRKAEEAGCVCRMVSEEEDPGQIAEAVWQIEKKSWKHKAGTGIDASRITKRFYQNIFRIAHDQGSLYMAMMEINKQPVAYDFNWSSGDTVFSLKMGFDEDFRKIAPGKILFAYTIKKSIEDGFRHHELMGINENFKGEWTDKLRKHSRFHVYHKGMVSTITRHINFTAKPILKSIFGNSGKID
jgi:CelD/BcsL family acetyltransferase involved in cellulose biosynthesis